MSFRALAVLIIVWGFSASVPMTGEADSNHLWSQQFGDADLQYPASVAADGSGNVLMTGFFAGSMNFGGGPLVSVGLYDIFLAKFDASGNHLWSYRFGDAGDQYAVGVASDGSGNVLITGGFAGTVDFGGGLLTSAGDSDIFLAKLDASGNHLWSRGFGETNYQDAVSVTSDGSGNILITGSFADAVDFGGGLLTSAGADDIFLAKFDASGNHLWSRQFGDASAQYSESVALDRSGNVLLTGRYYGSADFGGGPLPSAGFEDIFLAKFDASGNHLWSHRFGDASEQVAWSVVADGAENVLVTGIFFSTVDFGDGPLVSAGQYDIFLAKFDALGNHLWSRRFGDANFQDAEDVVVDGSGNVLVSGSFLGAVDFGNGPLVSAGSWDTFLAEFDAAGNSLGSRNFGDADRQFAEALAIDGSESVLMAGPFDGTVDFGGGPLMSTDSLDAFLVKFERTVLGIDEPRVSPMPQLSAYPNPFRGESIVTYVLPESSKVKMTIHDALGSIVAVLVEEEKSAGTHEARWDGRTGQGCRVGGGVYFVKVEAARQTYSLKLVLLD